MEVRVEDYALAVGEPTAEKRPKTRPKRTSVRKRAARKPAAEKTETAKKASTRRTTARTTRTARPRARKKVATVAPQTSRPPAPDEELRIIDVIGASAISVPAQMPTDVLPAAVAAARVEPVEPEIVEAEAVALIETVESAPASIVAPAAPRARSIMRRRIILPLVITALALAVTAGAFAFLSTPSASQTLTEAEVQKVVSAVGELIILPADETPLVASVINADLLRAQEPFYQYAEDGNILLLYGESGRAILYDRERNIIVNIGTLQNPPATGE